MLALTLAAGLLLPGQAEPAPDGVWTPLFNGRDLDGWYTFLQDHGKDADPDRVITIEDGSIHLYKHADDGAKVVMGYIGTTKEYGDYHLRFQYRWGTKKFEPRYALKRDAGLYYHLTGDDAIWPRALQFQVEQTNVGDLIALYGMQLDATIDPATAGDDIPRYLPAEQGGQPRVLGGKGIAYQGHLAGEFEVDGWNTAEIIAKGDSVLHKLNGRVVNRGEHVRFVDPADPDHPRPLARGRIALEIEAAEIFFRNVEIRDISRQGESGLKAGAASKALEATDDLVIGGGIGPGHAEGQEGDLRASAVVIEAPDGSRACLVAIDVLMLGRDILDDAARRIEARTGIPLERILINCTHTHSAPTTVSIHGYEREEEFSRQAGDRAVEAAVAAFERLGPAELLFQLGEESSVGRNSRLLMGDGTIFWVGPRDDAVRPTGPFDPELPVLALVRPDGSPEAVLFNHSTHTIGTLKPGVRSPSFYGLAAQGLESERGGTFLFFEGASGSTHNLDLKTDEALLRIQSAVADALDDAAPRPVPHIAGRRRQMTVRVRTFDETEEDAAVSSYCKKRMPEPWADRTIGIFREMRRRLSPHQGEERSTWVQAIVLGDVAIVGVPAEFFTTLGQEIKRRSPYRHTYVFELANDYVGYLPDRAAHDLGGYQTWTGLHSYLEPGTGERMVGEVVDLLRQLRAEEAAP